MRLPNSNNRDRTVSKGQTNENSLSNLTPFQKGKSGNPNGRPRKFVSTLVEHGYKVSEINDTIQSLLAMTLKELKGVGDDDEATILEVIVARALYSDAVKGRVTNMETILSRVFGHPKQSFEGTVTEQPFFPDVEYPDVIDTEHKEVE